MCGIIYMHSDVPVSQRVLERYRAQRNRGYEGFGFVAFTKRNIKRYARFQTEEGIKKALRETDATNILFHHRFPTSTENVAETAHPIKVSHKELEYDYYVTHNGIISNPLKLKVDHEKLGYKYTTELQTQYVTMNGTVYTGGVNFNDTESLAIELARNIELGTPVMATGSASFIVLRVAKDGKRVHSVIYGTNGGNPLTITRGKGGLLCIASQGGAVPVKSMVMYELDLKSGITTNTLLDMVPYVTTPPTVGYGAYHGAYSRELENDDEPDELSRSSSEGMIAELEDQLSDLEQDIKLAKQAEEWEELDDLYLEQSAIENDLLELYDAVGYDVTRLIA